MRHAGPAITFATVLFLVALEATRADAQVQYHVVEPRKPPPPTDAVGYLNSGLLLSSVAGREPVAGYGVEVSYMHYPTGDCGFGGFAQTQYLSAGTQRSALGTQAACSIAGLELGVGYRDSDEHFVGTTALHLGMFVSFGVVGFSVRSALPLHGSGDPQRTTYGSESAVSLTVKIPLRIYGTRKLVEFPRGVFGGG